MSSNWGEIDTNPYFKQIILSSNFKYIDYIYFWQDGYTVIIEYLVCLY